MDRLTLYLDLEQKAAIRFIVFLWKHVDKRPSRVDTWYPGHVQMMSALKKMHKLISASGLPTPLMKYVLHPITDSDMLEKHAYDFYCDFEDHPSEYLETFICHLQRKMREEDKLNKKKK